MPVTTGQVDEDSNGADEEDSAKRNLRKTQAALDAGVKKLQSQKTKLQIKDERFVQALEEGSKTSSIRRLQLHTHKMLSSFKFDAFVGGVIILNCATIGMELQAELGGHRGSTSSAIKLLI